MPPGSSNRKWSVASLTVALWWSAAALVQQSSDAPRPAAQPAPAGYETSELVEAAHQLIADDLPRLQARADMGDPRSQVLLGLAYEMGSAGLTPQPPQALAWFLKAAAQGVPWAEAWAADFYFSGKPWYRARFHQGAGALSVRRRPG